MESKSLRHRSLNLCRKVAFAFRALDHPEMKLAAASAKSVSKFDQQLLGVSGASLGTLDTSAVPRYRVSPGKLSLKEADGSFGDDCNAVLAQCEERIVIDEHCHTAQSSHQAVATGSKRTFPQADISSANAVLSPPQPADQQELFFSVGAAPSKVEQKPTNRPSDTDVAAIKSASMSMPLQQFLQWVTETYSIDRMLPQKPQAVLAPTQQPLPSQNQGLYQQLLALKSSYNPKRHLIEDRHAFEIIAALYCELKWLHMRIDYRLKEIELYHTALSIRDFVSWAYDNFKIPESSKLFGRLRRWNPHHIRRTSTVIEEAIEYYEQEEFAIHEGELSMYAKHIVWLLRGGRDWRECSGERLVSCHPTPAEMATLRTMLSNHCLRP